jgi:hypothetical protein
MGFPAQKTPDQYLIEVLQRYQPNPDQVLLAKNQAEELYSQVERWAGNNLLAAQYSGSYAKGSAIVGSSDVDIFLSLSNQSFANHADQYNDLMSFLRKEGLNPKMQNVSIRISKNGFPIDLVPGWKHQGNTKDHSLYVSKQQTWTKTNVETHIILVKYSGVLNEIRLAKIWREKHKLDFPSFFLELTVRDALLSCRISGLSGRFSKVLAFLRDSFVNNRIQDPANSKNIISNDLSTEEKRLISGVASDSIKQAYWEDIV